MHKYRKVCLLKSFWLVLTIRESNVRRNAQTPTTLIGT